MAVDLFMVFGPAAGLGSSTNLTIQGESQAKFDVPPGLPDGTQSKNTPVEVLGYSFGIENRTTIGSSSSGAGAGKAQFNALTVVKKVDAASPKLLQACAMGAHYKFANLILRKSGGASSSALPYLVFNFAMVFVSSVDYGTGTPDDINQYGQDVLERVTFAYGAFQMNYYKQKSNGSLDTTLNQASWSQLTNRADISDALK